MWTSERDLIKQVGSDQWEVCAGEAWQESLSEKNETSCLSKCARGTRIRKKNWKPFGNKTETF